jgi:hypothetical protein
MLLPYHSIVQARDSQSWIRVGSGDTNPRIPIRYCVWNLPPGPPEHPRAAGKPTASRMLPSICAPLVPPLLPVLARPIDVRLATMARTWSCSHRGRVATGRPPIDQAVDCDPDTRTISRNPDPAEAPGRNGLRHTPSIEPFSRGPER